MARIDYLQRIWSAYVLNRCDSNTSFWHTTLSVNQLDDYDLNNVHRYPMNFISKIDYKNYTDDDGIIMLNYRGNIGLQYNPNAIAQQALGFYDNYISEGGRKWEDAFLTQASYFLKKGRAIRDDIVLWEYNFPFEMRNNLSSPWRSALAQGQALSVLIRAHKMTKKGLFAELAHKGYNAFLYLARDHEGGVLDDQDGYTWLEEYIVNPPNHVLNGFIWALWGVRDYAVYFKDNQAYNLWEECLRTLEANLANYDLGFWTGYDWPQGYDKIQPIMPASMYYQRLHAVQMLAMYNLTRRRVFLRYYRMWYSYLQSPRNKVISQVWKAYFKFRHF